MTSMNLEALRNNFKHYILRRVLFRFDFSGMLDTDIEKIIPEIRDKYYSHGLTHMDLKQVDNLDIKINSGSNIPDNERIAFNSYNKDKVYSFESEEGEVIEIGRNFFSFCIKDVKEYKSFDKYKNILVKTIMALKNTNTNFFKATRIGLRKFNSCYLKDINKLNDYFSNSAFNLNQIKNDLEGFKNISLRLVNFLQKDYFKVNYCRETIDGFMEESDGKHESSNLVVTDIDVYCDDVVKLTNLLEQEKSIEKCLNKQNSIEFEVFLSSITKKMIKELSTNNFVNEDIKGVY